MLNSSKDHVRNSPWGCVLVTYSKFQISEVVKKDQRTLYYDDIYVFGPLFKFHQIAFNKVIDFIFTLNIMLS